jgi:hypothetical protein
VAGGALVALTLGGLGLKFPAEAVFDRSFQITVMAAADYWAMNGLMRPKSSVFSLKTGCGDDNPCYRTVWINPGGLNAGGAALRVTSVAPFSHLGQQKQPVSFADACEQRIEQHRQRQTWNTMRRTASVPNHRGGGTRPFWPALPVVVAESGLRQSAADAQRFAAEFIGRYERERPGPHPALTTDSSILTAIVTTTTSA